MTNEVELCRKGHHHFSTCWTIYVVDPEKSQNAKSYGQALFPLQVFDTKEETDNLYKLESFVEPNGPPSWSMVVPGGAIAVFRGGKFGIKAVKPEWEDPAAQNGGEFRFVFVRGQSPVKLIDNIFLQLVQWMAGHPNCKGTQLLGLFIKNTAVGGANVDANSNTGIQVRLWIAEPSGSDVEQLVLAIGDEMARVLGSAGATGMITYKSLGELIKRSGAADLLGKQPRQFSVRIQVPSGAVFHKDNGNTGPNNH